MSLHAPCQAGTAKAADADGFVQWKLPIPPNASGLDVWFQVAQTNLKAATIATRVE